MRTRYTIFHSYSLLTSLILFLEVSGQDKKIDIPIEDSANYSNYHKKSLAELNLKSIEYSTDSLRIRIWTTRQVIEFVIKERDNIQATVINFVWQETVNKKETKAFDNQKRIYSTVKIDSLTSIRVLNLLSTLHLETIPNEYGIPNKAFFVHDGNSYTIETSTKTYYKRANYSNPELRFSSIGEAKTILIAIDILKAELDLNTKYNQFLNSLPKGLYTIGNVQIQKK